MRGAFLGKGEDYYTLLSKVFTAIDNKQLNLNWLITNCECHPQNESFYELFQKEYIWISGRQLTEIIQEEDFQFIWGVFSGFSTEITLEEVLGFKLTNADYEGYWIKNLQIQHPIAEMEIIAFDSSYTLLISKKDKIVQEFLDYFPFAEDLTEKNKRRNL